jgi:hypothetical protein
MEPNSEQVLVSAMHEINTRTEELRRALIDNSGDGEFYTLLADSIIEQASLIKAEFED